MNAGKSTENATSVPTLANVAGLSLGEETAIDESDLFGALSESDEVRNSFCVIVWLSITFILLFHYNRVTGP